jgi:hypothetical protein
MPSQCPYCFGTGRNKRGGPCKRCRNTGEIATPLAGAKNTLDTARALFLLVIVALVIYALVSH